MKLNKKISPNVLKNLNELTSFTVVPQIPIKQIHFVKAKKNGERYFVYAEKDEGVGTLCLGEINSTELSELLNNNEHFLYQPVELIKYKAVTSADKELLDSYILHGTRTTSPARKPTARKSVVRKPATRKPAWK